MKIWPVIKYVTRHFFTSSVNPTLRLARITGDDVKVWNNSLINIPFHFLFESSLLKNQRT